MDAAFMSEGEERRESARHSARARWAKKGKGGPVMRRSDRSFPEHPRDALRGIVPYGSPAIRFMDAKLLLGRPPGTFRHPVVQSAGMTIRQIGDRVYRRPLHETFHDFLVGFIIKQFGGVDWLLRQFTLRQEEQHVVTLWFSRTRATITAASSPGPTIPTSGHMSELMSLSYDLALLIDRRCLPAATMERLRKTSEFQGARFEVATAAIAIRAGCDVEHITDVNIRSPEFIATDRLNGARFCVEAKARHRKGVLHQSGHADMSRAARADVDRLISEALQKDCRGLPYIVLVDVNAPMIRGSHHVDQEWFQDAWRCFGPHSEHRRKRLAKINALWLVNFARHYAGDNLAPRTEMFSSTLVETPGFPLPEETLALPEETVGRFAAAVSAHGYAPDEMLTEEDLERRFVTVDAAEVSDPQTLVLLFYANQQIGRGVTADWDRVAALFHPNAMVGQRYGVESESRTWQEYLGTCQKRAATLRSAEFHVVLDGISAPTPETLRIAVDVQANFETLSGVRYEGQESSEFHLWSGRGRWWLLSLVLHRPSADEIAAALRDA
jgi:hypothetical protein